jgi:hypothetical protein
MNRTPTPVMPFVRTDDFRGRNFGMRRSQPGAYRLGSSADRAQMVGESGRLCLSLS